MAGLDDAEATLHKNSAAKTTPARRSHATWDFFGDNNAKVVNLFPARREKLKSFNYEITDIAAQGNHVEMERILREYLSVLITHNNSISRYIATPFKNKASETPSQNNIYLANEVNQLFREHNRHFIQLRGLLKHFIEQAPMLAPSSERVDDFVMLDQAQTDMVQDMVVMYGRVLSALEQVWNRLERFENAIYAKKLKG